MTGIRNRTCRLAWKKLQVPLALRPLLRCRCPIWLLRAHRLTPYWQQPVRLYRFAHRENRLHTNRYLSAENRQRSAVF